MLHQFLAVPWGLLHPPLETAPTRRTRVGEATEATYTFMIIYLQTRLCRFAVFPSATHTHTQTRIGGQRITVQFSIP
jgi:hypothetical protein